MITRKHYKQFAELLLRLRSALRSGSEPLQAVDQFEQELCLLLKEDNPLFSKARFLAASGAAKFKPLEDYGHCPYIHDCNLKY